MRDREKRLLLRWLNALRDLTKFGIEQLRRGVHDIANGNAIHARDFCDVIRDHFLGKKWISNQQPFAWRMRSVGVVRLMQCCEAMISWTE